VAPNTKSFDPKVNMQIWVPYTKKKTTITLQMKDTTDERKEYGAEDSYSSEPQKAHLTLVSS